MILQVAIPSLPLLLALQSFHMPRGCTSCRSSSWTFPPPNHWVQDPSIRPWLAGPIEGRNEEEKTSRLNYFLTERFLDPGVGRYIYIYIISNNAVKWRVNHPSRTKVQKVASVSERYIRVFQKMRGQVGKSESIFVLFLP